jgi:hypothetical protein
MEGFYVAYMTGPAGQTILMFALTKGKFVGADMGGIKYDGTFKAKPDGSAYRFSVVYVVPAGASLITGAPPSATPVTVPVEFELPRDFTDGRVITIETPRGPVNAKFGKLRDL